MTEKLGKDESIARVYQFLSGRNNWFQEADAKGKDGGDGVLIETEFRSYMLQFKEQINYNWNGEEKYDANDIITKFWKSVDVNTMGQISGVGASNKNALDKNELGNMEKNLEITDVIKDFVENSGNVTLPDGLSNNYQEKFIESFKASLLNKAIANFASTEFNENNKTEFDNNVVAFLNTVKDDSYRITSADYYKYQAIDNVNDKVDTKYGYNAKQDTRLENIIEGYIKTIKNNQDVDYNEIKKAIDALVNDYLNTAGLGDKNQDDSNTKFRDIQGAEKTYATAEERLKAFNYRTSSGLNDLQVKVLTNKLTEAIKDKLKEDGNSETYKKYKTQVDARIPEYVKENINANKSFSDMEAEIQDLAKKFISDELENIKKIAEDETLNAAKNDAITKVTGYNKTYPDAVKEIFGEDFKATINACTSTDTIDDLVKKLEAKIAEIQKAEAEKAKYSGSFSALSSIASSISSNSTTINYIKSGHDEIHTEFGLDSEGNIIFEQSETTGVYGALVSKIKSEFKIKNPDEYEALKAKIDRLVQAAWIMTYSTDMGSSTSHNTSDFVQKTLTNLQLILTTVSRNPEYLSVYTDHTAYADSTLTSGLKYYGKDSLTHGNDQKINYGGDAYRKTDGSVHIANSRDDEDYQVTMDELLSRLKTKYAAVANDDLIESVFRDAQMEAIKIFQGNIEDCPYGTTYRLDFRDMYGAGAYRDQNYVAMEHKDWAGTARYDDSNVATMQALVQQTLYCFDRLLYARLAE